MLTNRQKKLIYWMVKLGLWKYQVYMRIPWVWPNFGSEWLHERLLKVQDVDDLHHAPCCPANHYHRRRLVFCRCTCGAVFGKPG